MGPNPFSEVCVEFAKRVRDLAAPGDSDVDFRVGSPGHAEKYLQNLRSGFQGFLNFFFYRFHPWEFDTDLRPDEVFRVRASCMITPFFKDLDLTTDAWEFELWMVGEVLRVLHENQVMLVGEFGPGGREEEVRLQIALQKPEMEELNHLWSTQPEATFRSSLVYELALVPVFPNEERSVPPLVATTGVRVRALVDKSGKVDKSWAKPEEFDGVDDEPVVEQAGYDRDNEAWAPLICFVKGGVCSAVVRTTAAGFAGHLVWVVGDLGVQVTLRWRTWTRDGGWQDEATTVDAVASHETLDPASTPDEEFRPPSDPEFDANHDTKYSKGELRKVELPGSVAGGGQAALVAVREYTRASEELPDGTFPRTYTVESEPLLVVVTP